MVLESSSPSLCPTSNPVFPPPASLLEEVVAATPLSRAASLAFAIQRCGADGALMTIMPRAERREFGRPSLHGVAALRSGPLLMVVTLSLADALWAMEQALKSGALSGVIGVIEGASLTQTRRLDFAARDGATPAVLLRARGGGLSAARRRWRIGALPGLGHPHDAAAPGAPRLYAELLRQRDGPPAAWVLDHDPVHGFAVAARLAADGARQAGRRAA